MVRLISHVQDGIDVLELKNENMSVWLTNFGCTVLKVFVRDRMGVFQNVVLSMPSVEDYMVRDGSYMGAVVGRVANRIAGGRFSLNGKEYCLAVNNGPNCLHGGVDGFSYRVFDYEILGDAVRFHYVSEDGEENFPGCLDLFVTYSLCDCSLVMDYEAVSDADTVVNLTNHSYFNLSGRACSVEDHLLQVCADQFGCVDADGLFTHVLRDVAGSCFDLNVPVRVGDVLSGEDVQLDLAHGLDHSFVFNRDYDQVVLFCEESGIELRVSSSMPAAQIYSGNFLKNHFNGRDGICVETQFMPDCIDDFILKRDERYKERTVFTFGVR